MTNSDGEETETDSVDGKITVTPSDDDVYKNETYVAEVSMSDSDLVCAYEYYIYKGNTVFKESEIIYTDSCTSQEYKDSITLNVPEYDDGTYRIKIKTYDQYGFTREKTSKNIIIDTKDPTCVVKLDKEPDGENGWYKSNVTASVQFGVETNPSDIMGISTSITPSYNNKTLTQSDTKGQIIYGYVKDKAGNTGRCTVESIKIDTIAPEVSLNVVSADNRYNTANAKIEVTASDSNSVRFDLSTETFSNNLYSGMYYSVTNGKATIASFPVHSVYDGNLKYVFVTAKDEAGNRSGKYM